MKNNIAKIVAFALTLVMLLSALPATVAIAADYKDAKVSNNAAPIVALLEVESEDPETKEPVTKVNEYEVVTNNGTHYLFLPGSADITAVKVKYTGSKELFTEFDDGLYLSGQVAEYDFSEGSAKIYEYDSDKDQYTVYALRILQGSDVPSLYLTLDEVAGAPNTLAWLNEKKSNETTGALVMLDADGNVVYDNTCDTIKGRGNTSFVAPGIQYDYEHGYKDEKKSFNIKLTKKAELIEGAGKMKKWSLIHMRISEAYYYDWTGLCFNLGFQTYRTLAGEGYFGNMSQYVDLYVDGEYRGAYILVERLDNNAAVDVTDQEDFVVSESEGRTMVQDPSDPAIKAGVRYYLYTADAVKNAEFDITGGYLLEANYGNLEECGFVTRRGLYFDLKAPEACLKEQVQYIAKYVQDFENALYSESGYNNEGKHYTEYIDSESLANMILTYAFYQNWELFRTSTYAYIDVADSDHPKLTFGPAWDFETGPQILTGDDTFFGEHNTYADKQQYIWLEQLWKKADFMAVLYERAKALAPVLEASFGGKAMDGITTAKEFADDAYDSLVMNWTRWGLEDYLDGRYGGHDNDFDYYKDTYLDALDVRHENWKGFWNEEKYVLGASVSGEYEIGSGTNALFCQVNSTGAVAYQWYELANDGATLNVIKGETGAYLITDKEGSYVCEVTGGNNAFWAGANGSVFSNNKVSMFTAPFDTADADQVGEFEVSEHVPGDWEYAEEPTCSSRGLRVKRCTVCEGAEVLVSERTEYGDHDEGKWIVEKRPTEDRTGVEVLRCTFCNEELDRRTLPKVFNNKFTDVDMTKWYAKAVEFAVTNDLFNGVSSNRFDPNGSMTRAMLVTVLARLDGVSVDNNMRCSFTDVKQGQWYTGAVIWASKKGIVNGVGNNKFNPDGTVTREQVAAILFRYAGFKGIETNERADLSVFEDAGKISAYAEEAMAWINGVQIIKGVSATKIAPGDNCTRAQVAEMLRLYYDKYLAE